ncbi:hypothetical protein LCGC14_3071160 [marine sediment metagenome]|uniref:Uncharacterized protein n=1 Tax=marine sediment metagenome TaxID=412755 RepID=A0A0F8WG06_9ZZZZ
MKSPQIEATLDAVSHRLFGRSCKDPICVTCGTDKIRPEHFRDNKSRREFKTSRMCQGCQDDVFGADDEEQKVDKKGDGHA